MRTLEAPRKRPTSAKRKCTEIQRKVRRFLPTDKQAEMLSFIESHIRVYGAAPSVRQIGAEFGITTTNGVAWHLQALQRKGWLTVDPNKNRSLQVTKGILIVGEVS